ncbi:MAG: pitrilysin family protein [Patescibacteria group bacterium]|nr:pitrilysin family protein [Patescibacteria group bacterium]MDD4610623.1 pitrilysin family protein [Patescibacteria group bacterium]
MYKQKILKNGLKLITVPMKGTKTATILVLVGAGSKYEIRENSGISHFLEHMFFKGTKKRPSTKILSSELDSVGAEFNAFTSKEYTGYYVKVSAEKINLGIDIVSDILLNSKFDSREIEKEKGVIAEEINMYYENPLMYIETLFEECMFGDTPAGWNVAGLKENVTKFKREDFIKYFTTHYGAKNTAICLAGNFKPSAVKLIEQKFARFGHKNLQDKIKTEVKQGAPKVLLNFKEGQQVNLSLGVRAFSIGHKDEYVLKLLSIILGGGMSSRLFINLREHHGLAYYVRTTAELYTDSGYLTTQAGVPAGKIDEATKIILSEYKKISDEIVGAKELQKAKDLIRGRLTLHLESSEDVANWHAEDLVLEEKITTPEQFFKKIDQVTAGDIKRVAREIFVNHGLNLAVIGPYKDKERFEKILKL